MESLDLIPVHCFLHRVFPIKHYDDLDKFLDDRIFKPRKDSDPFYLKFPLDWESKNKNVDRNWRMQLQGWTFFHPVMNFFDKYEDKERIIDFFFDAVSDWWDVYGKDPDDVVTTRMPKSYAWYDMSVGFRALSITFFINRIKYYGIVLSKERNQLLNDIAYKHIRNLRNPKVFSMNNHGLFQSHGLVGLLKTAPYLSDSLESDLSYGLALVEELIISQFGELGVHLEHSPHYHFYALSTLKAQIDSGWYDDKPSIKLIAERADENSKWLVDPLRRPICVGDSILTPQKNVFFPSTHKGKYVTSKISECGYSIVRSGWAEHPESSSMLFFTGAYHTKSHKHRDCLSFDWFDRGNRVLCDSGKYGYVSDKYRNYFLSNRAHNSVEIEGFDILKIKPYGSAVEDPEEIGEGIYRLKGSLDYPAIKHNRDLFFKPGSWIIIRDSLCFAREREFKQWFHLDKRFIIESLSNNHLAFKDGESSLYVECMNKELAVNVHYDDHKNMQGFICEKDYEYLASFAVSFSGRCKESDIYTIISLSENSHESAKYFLGNYFDKKVGSEPNIDNGKSEIIKSVHNSKFFDIESFRESIKNHSGDKTFQVLSKNIPISFYGSFNESNKKLAIFLPGATARKYGEYDFQRYTWGKDLDGFDSVFFSDPSIKKENDLTLGWFQHSEDHFGIAAVAEIIQSIISERGYYDNKVMIFGSSGGGFVSLKLSDFFKDALVFAINPQIYLYNYSKSFYERMIDCCYEGRSSDFVKDNYKSRITFSPSFGERENPVVILQNTKDEMHFNRHFLPMAKKFEIDYCHIDDMNSSKSNEPFYLYVYSDSALKHTPPNKDDTLGYFAMIFEKYSF